MSSAHAIEGLLRGLTVVCRRCRFSQALQLGAKPPNLGKINVEPTSDISISDSQSCDQVVDLDLVPNRMAPWHFAKQRLLKLSPFIVVGGRPKGAEVRTVPIT